MIRKLFALLATTATATTLSLSIAPQAAQAEEGGGSGSGVCSGVCNLSGPWYWRYTATTPAATAWQKFAGKSPGSVGLSGMRRQTTENNLLKHVSPVGNMSNKQLLALCQSSDYVWWVSGSNPVYKGRGNAWAYNLSSRTFPATSSGRYFTEAQRAEQYSSMDLNYERSMVDWVQKRSNRNYVILCSDMFDTPDPIKPSPIVKKYQRTYNADGRTVYRHPYSYSYEVRRQDISAPEGSAPDPIGDDNLHDQPMKVVLTNYGKLYNAMKFSPDSYKDLTATQVKAKIDAALLKDKDLLAPSVDLDEPNKRGLAEGGVLNVVKYSREAEIYSSSTRTTVQNCTVTIDWYYSSYREKWLKKDPVTTCVNDSSTDTTTSVGKVGLTKPVSFWQILSVHCNRDQAMELQQATGATIKQYGTTRSTDVLYSKPVTLTDNQEIPDTLDFGDVSNPDPIKAASGKLEFYTQKCGEEFDCISETRRYAPTKADNNIMYSEFRDGKTYKVHKYGAVSGNINGSNFTFFRDNKNHRIETDVWYPELTDSAIVAANSRYQDVESGKWYSRWDRGEYAHTRDASTTVSRWSEGTPDVKGDGPKFTMTDEDGKPVFDEDSPVTRKYPGVMDTFDVKSSWASQVDKPQLVNFKWNYKIRIPFTFSIQTTDLADPDPTKAVQRQEIRIAEKDCYSQYGQTYYEDPELRSDEWLDGYIVGMNDPSTMQIKFIRSTSE